MAAIFFNANYDWCIVGYGLFFMEAPKDHVIHVFILQTFFV